MRADGFLSQLQGMLIVGKTHAMCSCTIMLFGKKSLINTFDGVYTDLSGLHFQIALVLGMIDRL